jgi:hypothetical protein
MRTYNPTLRFICNNEEKHAHMIESMTSKGYIFQGTRKESVNNQEVRVILAFSKLGISNELDQFKSKISEDLEELKDCFSDYEIEVII